MPIHNAYPDLVADSERLLTATVQNAEALPGSQGLRENLELRLSNLKIEKATQENYEANRQAATRRLREASELVREAARRLRCFVKGALGTRSEQLPQFGIAPSRARQNRKQDVEKVA